MGSEHLSGDRVLVAAVIATLLVYAPGLGGSWLFDDFPNIVNNPSVQFDRLGWSAIVRAALSSPASEFKRPLASLSFLGNYWLSGLQPFSWKVVNLLIHVLNGCLVYALVRRLRELGTWQTIGRDAASIDAAVVAAAWLLLPINLTPVLFVVQRMESLANLSVLAGLIAYVEGRRRMHGALPGGFSLVLGGLLSGTLLGMSAKETAIMLPLYACLVEWVLFDFRAPDGRRDRRILGLFGLILVAPAMAGLAWLAPWLLRPETWGARDYTLGERLLTESRVVMGYAASTFVPLPQWLSFYHDDVAVSRGLFSPWTTAVSLLALAALLSLAIALRRRLPSFALGCALFFGCHLLTGTVLPLELAFEHRNYFASLGLLIAALPLLRSRRLPLSRVRHGLLALLLASWTGQTLVTAYAWGDPLRLATELAARAPASPRAQFAYAQELLRQTGADVDSEQAKHAFLILERAGQLRGSSILPEQTQILLSVVNHRPIEARWWDRLVDKLHAMPPNGEDLDALGALTRCARDKRCDLPRDLMEAAFAAAESHPKPNAQLLTIHGDYAWNVCDDKPRGEQLAEASVRADPADASARMTLARMNLVLGNYAKAREQLLAMERLNIAGELDPALEDFRALLSRREAAKAAFP